MTGETKRLDDDTGPPRTAGPIRRALRFAASRDYAGALVAVVVIYVGVGVMHPAFFGLNRIANVLNQAAFVGILAIGVAILLGMRHVDLSVGAMFGLASMTTALMWPHVGIPLSILAGVAVAALSGFVNGVLIRLLVLPSIVVTLATMQVFRGLTIAISDGRQVRGPELDTWFLELVVARPLGIPFTAWVLVAVVVIMTLVMNRTVLGYRILSIGSNPDAAKFSGVPTSSTEFIAFVIMGVLAGIAGTMALGFFGAADPNSGLGMELRAIAAAVIGGTSLRGGRVSVAGAAVGAIVLALISSALAQFRIPLIWNAFATGLAILTAISIDTVLRRSVSRASSNQSTTAIQ